MTTQNQSATTMVLANLFTTFLFLATAQCSFYPDHVHGEIYFQNTGTCLPPLYRGLIINPFKRSYKHEEMIELSCEEGYELKAGRQNSTCRVFAVFGAHGVFMPAVTPETCRRLPKCRAPIEDGVIIEPFKTFYEIGENISLSCGEGYELVQPAQQTCKRYRRGYYRSGYVSFNDNNKPACRKIRDCIVPLHDGLIVEPFKPSYKRGEKITLSCEEEYELVTKSTSICDENGEFNTDIDEIKFPTTAHFEYHLIFTTSPCRKRASCSVRNYPGIVATPEKDTYLTGEEIAISCEEDYDLTGPNMTTCTFVENNLYFGSFLEREPTGGFKPRISHKTCTKKPRCYSPIKQKMTISPQKKYYMVGETIEISCDEGYELKGESTQTCEKDKRGWSGYSAGRFMPGMDNVVCKKKPSCRAPKSKGVVLSPKKKVYGIGETVSVSCEEGYILKNKKESVCKEIKNTFHRFRSDKTEGNFSPEIDGKVCEKIPSCDRPTKRDGVIFSPDKSYYEIGDKLDIACKDGYELRVAPATTCTRTLSTAIRKEGKFDPNISGEICRKHISCTAPEGENFSVTPSKEKYEEGDEISIACNAGYELVGQETLTCERSTNCRGQKGLVSGCFYPILSKPVCSTIPTCKAPKNQEGLVISPLQEKYPTGDEINLSCEEGYELTVANSSTCELKESTLHTALGTRNVKELVFNPEIKEGACKKLPEMSKEQEEKKDEEQDEVAPESTKMTEMEGDKDKP